MTVKHPIDLLKDPSKWDLVGPTVDEDIHRAILRYGFDAVKASVERQPKPKLGRPPLKDWTELLPVIESDARLWLAGGDPVSTVSNYSIAKDFANRTPGQSPLATHKRIEDKLRKKREVMFLIRAMIISRDEYPYADHIRALTALIESSCNESVKTMLESVQRTVSDYEAKFGAPPSAQISFGEVESQLNNIQRGIGGLTVSNASLWETKA